LHKQDIQPRLEDLHKELTMWQKRTDWEDVVDFWGEFLADAIRDSKQRLSGYKDFLIEVGHFEASILKKRLYPQWKRITTANPHLSDPEFDKILLDIIARESDDI
jgi:hypothetical protein